MPKIIYTSDLHGTKELYNKLIQKAKEENCDAIIIGGDLCPRKKGEINEIVEYQKIFLENFLVPLFGDFKKRNKNKKIYLIMGNDDFRVNMDILENADKNNILNSIHNKIKEINKKINILGYSFVNTTPFSLKDWEKPDSLGSIVPNQLFNTEVRTVKKEDGTIEDDFKKIKKLGSPKNTIYVIHAPPYNTKLDMVATGHHVGSKAVRAFIEKEQPLLALHGHIHESPEISGSWKDKIGNTICINVGSNYPELKFNYAIIHLDNAVKNVQYFQD